MAIDLGQEPMRVVSSSLSSPSPTSLKNSKVGYVCITVKSVCDCGETLLKSPDVKTCYRFNNVYCTVHIDIVLCMLQDERMVKGYV
jgi:hypothetical protein